MSSESADIKLKLNNLGWNEDRPIQKQHAIIHEIHVQNEKVQQQVPQWKNVGPKRVRTTQQYLPII